MVELSGVVGDRPGDVERLADFVEITTADERSTYIDDSFGLHLQDHSFNGRARAAAADDGETLVWVFGDAYGFDARDLDSAAEPSDRAAGIHTATTPGSPRRSRTDGEGYASRPSHVDPAEYCARLYDRYGRRFAAGLNGSFVCVLFDRRAGTVSLVTDRLGTRPVFYATPTDGTVVFSTQIQALARHPALDPTFDPEYLAEFLTYRRAFGTKTPLAGVEKLLPSALTTVDVGSGSVDAERYWRPVRDPIDEPFDRFLDRFTRVLRTVLRDRFRDDAEHGVLLSGGSDSRLLLACDATARVYHMSGWMSREARTAERVAARADVPFRYLRRDDGYDARLFERNGSLSNFDGWFTQGYVTDFADDIDPATDVLLSGLYADTLFKGDSIPTRTVSLGPFGSVETPLERRVESVAEFVDHAARETPAYASDLPDANEAFAANVSRTATGIDHHGVEYDSVAELVHCSRFYPMANDSELINPNSLRQLRPYRSPFLDNRLVDLHLRMPTEYMLKRNVVDRAVERLTPDLAEIPHAATRTPVKYPRPVSYLGRLGTEFVEKYLGSDAAPRPYLNNGPWTNRAELVRASSFPRETLAANRDLVRATPGLDWTGVADCYRDHLRGANNTLGIYSLLTLLSMPVTAAAAGETGFEFESESESGSESPLRVRSNGRIMTGDGGTR